jgi:hypothetical protein
LLLYWPRNWQLKNCVSISVLKTLPHFLDLLGLSVYLYVSASYLLQDVSLAELDELTGLVIYNGTINSNGAERDAFQVSDGSYEAKDQSFCISSLLTRLCGASLGDSRR